jgi:hypothetical protein
MKLDILTIVGMGRISSEKTSINIKKCIEDIKILDSIDFCSQNGRLNKKSIKISGYIELHFNNITFKLKSSYLLHTWTFLVIGIEQILKNEKAKSPLIDPGFFMIPNKAQGIALGYDWSLKHEEFIIDEGESEDTTPAESPQDDFNCTIEIGDKFAFTKDVILAAREALTFYDLLYSSDTVFQTPDSRELIDLFRQYTDSLEATLGRTSPVETQ